MSAPILAGDEPNEPLAPPVPARHPTKTSPPLLPSTRGLPRHTLVLGIGNTLRSDDGLGPRFLAWYAERYIVPPGVVLIDGGTDGSRLLERLVPGDDLIVIDAIRPRDGDEPGTLVVLEQDNLDAPAGEPAAHDLDLGRLLRSARWFGVEPRSVRLLGLVVATTELGHGLSPRLTAALPWLAEALRSELRRLAEQRSGS